MDRTPRLFGALNVAAFVVGKLLDAEGRAQGLPSAVFFPLTFDPALLRL
jgi:hypothetical protein